MDSIRHTHTHTCLNRTRRTRPIQTRLLIRSHIAPKYPLLAMMIRNRIGLCRIDELRHRSSLLIVNPQHRIAPSQKQKRRRLIDGLAKRHGRLARLLFALLLARRRRVDRRRAIQLIAVGTIAAIRPDQIHTPLIAIAKLQALVAIAAVALVKVQFVAASAYAAAARYRRLTAMLARQSRTRRVGAQRRLCRGIGADRQCRRLVVAIGAVAHAVAELLRRNAVGR